MLQRPPDGLLAVRVPELGRLIRARREDQLAMGAEVTRRERGRYVDGEAPDGLAGGRIPERSLPSWLPVMIFLPSGPAARDRTIECCPKGPPRAGRSSHPTATLSSRADSQDGLAVGAERHADDRGMMLER